MTIIQYVHAFPIEQRTSFRVIDGCASPCMFTCSPNRAQHNDSESWLTVH